MASKVRVDMRLCNRVSEITVVQMNDVFKVTIDSPCDEAKDFVLSLGDLSITDFTDLSKSKIIESLRSGKWCPGCLIPTGVINAAALEAGMVSRSLARDRGVNSINFVIENKK